MGGDGEGRGLNCSSVSGVIWCFESVHLRQLSQSKLRSNGAAEVSSEALVGCFCWCLGQNPDLWGGNDLQVLESYGPSWKQEGEFVLLKHFIPVLLAPLCHGKAACSCCFILEAVKRSVCAVLKPAASLEGCNLFVSLCQLQAELLRLTAGLKVPSLQVKERNQEDLLCLCSVSRQGSCSERLCPAQLCWDLTISQEPGLMLLWGQHKQGWCCCVVSPVVGRKGMCVETMTLSSLKLSPRSRVLPDQDQGKCNQHQLLVSVISSEPVSGVTTGFSAWKVCVL